MEENKSYVEDDVLELSELIFGYDDITYNICPNKEQKELKFFKLIAEFLPKFSFQSQKKLQGIVDDLINDLQKLQKIRSLKNGARRFEEQKFVDEILNRIGQMKENDFVLLPCGFGSTNIVNGSEERVCSLLFQKNSSNLSVYLFNPGSIYGTTVPFQAKPLSSPYFLLKEVNEVNLNKEMFELILFFKNSEKIALKESSLYEVFLSSLKGKPFQVPASFAYNHISPLHIKQVIYLTISLLFDELGESEEKKEEFFFKFNYDIICKIKPTDYKSKNILIDANQKISSQLMNLKNEQLRREYIPIVSKKIEEIKDSLKNDHNLREIDSNKPLNFEYLSFNFLAIDHSNPNKTYQFTGVTNPKINFDINLKKSTIVEDVKRFYNDLLGMNDICILDHMDIFVSQLDSLNILEHNRSSYSSDDSSLIEYLNEICDIFSNSLKKLDNCVGSSTNYTKYLCFQFYIYAITIILLKNGKSIFYFVESLTFI